jgi:chromosome partitioning protein
MKTILIASQKGGSGKTTLAVHLAVEASPARKPVWVIDMDRQASLTRWHQRRPNDTPILGNTSISKLGDGLNAIRTKTSFVFIDSAPTISKETQALIGLADLVLIPVRPSPTDLWSVAATVELVKAQRKAFLFVLTQAKTTASITAQAISALAQYGKVAHTVIGDRVVYASSMTSGNVAREVQSRGAASKEISALWEEILSIIS